MSRDSQSKRLINETFGVDFTSFGAIIIRRRKASMHESNVAVWLESLERQRLLLRMTLPVVAERAGLSRATVCRILRKKQASASLEKVLAIAGVLGAEASLNLQEPSKIIEEEIQARAKRIVRMVQGTMALEAQGITDQEHIDHLVEVAASEIRAKPRKRLWMGQQSQSRDSSQSRAKPQSRNSLS
jgi:transcriptional regulator with XRE-family HTH domain